MTNLEQLRKWVFSISQCDPAINNDDKRIDMRISLPSNALVGYPSRFESTICALHGRSMDRPFERCHWDYLFNYIC